MAAYYSLLQWWAELVYLSQRCQPKDLEILCGEINWLSLVELAFSFLFPFCPHYLLLTFLWLVLCFFLAWLHSTGALPPPAGGGGERLPDAQTFQDREGEEAGGCYQGKTGYSSTYLLSCCLYLLFVWLCSYFGHVGHAAALEHPPAAKLFTEGDSHS